jgi:predicted GNAT family N-acyltransferase
MTAKSTGLAACPGFRLMTGSWSDLRDAASAVRMAVFVQEQGIDPALELDERDGTCVHAVVFDDRNMPVATGRLLPDDHIGRMAVLAHLRGKGVGAAILEELIRAATARGGREVHLNAQTTAVGFYLRAGFRAVGPQFEEAGIAHQAMVRDC